MSFVKNNMVITRILLGIGANTYNQLATVVSQIAFVPIFLKYWGVADYGKWLMLLTIPVFISIVNMSLAIVIANQVISLNSKIEQKNNAIELQKGAWVLFTSFGVVACILFWSIVKILKINNISELDEASITIYLSFVFIGICNFQNEIAHGALRAVGKYSTGLVLSSTLIIIEGLTIGVTVALGGDIDKAINAYICTTIFGNICFFFAVRKYAPSMTPGFKNANIVAAFKIIPLAISYLGIPSAQIILNQGMTIIVGLLAGPQTVAIFNTHRTLARIANQIIKSIGNSFWPEMSYSLGGNDKVIGKKLHSILFQLTMVLTIISCLALVVIGKPVYETWTKSAILYNSYIFISFLFLLVTQSLWISSSTVLKSINHHAGLAFISLILSLISITIAATLISHGFIWQSILALGIQDFFLAYFCITRALKYLNQTQVEFFKDVVNVGAIASFIKIVKTK